MHDPDNLSSLMDNARPVKILLLEGNTTGAELCIRALKTHNLANDLAWVKDRAEALNFLFRRGRYSGMSKNLRPKIVLLDLRLPNYYWLLINKVPETVRQFASDTKKALAEQPEGVRPR